MTAVLTDSRSIRIKGRSFLAVVLSPDLPFDHWLARLDDLAARSAGFFLGRPVVLDVADLPIDRADLQGLIEELGKRNVSIMGVEGARPSLLGPGMPPGLKGGRPASDVEATAKEPMFETPAAAPEESVEAGKPAAAVTVPEVRPVLQSTIIHEPVRSGQSILFPEGDVTIVGSVASGSEVIAGGSVHIYGAARGRIFAGSLGNRQSRIFCRRLEAEMLAIDGIYIMAEDMDPGFRGQPVQLWLEGDVIMAEILS